MATTFTNQATLSYNGNTVQSNVATGAVEGVLTVGKQAVSDEYTAGDTETYVISVINNSASDITGLTVTDDLGAYTFGTGTLQPLNYVDGTVQYYLNGAIQPTPSAVAGDNAGLVITGISVPAGGSAMLVYSATVNEYAPLSEGSTVTNTVTVTGTDICGAEAQETVSAISSAVLSLIKSVTPVPVAENGVLTYTFKLQNTGSAAVTADDDAVVSDTFAPVLTNISVTLDGAQLNPTDYTYNEDTGVFSTVAGVITVPAAEFAQDPVTGVQTVVPGTAELVVSGSVGTICDMQNP